MTATRWLLAYALAVVAITFVHEPLALAGLLVLGVAGAGKARRQLLKRALHLGFDVDFAGRPLDVPDPHPTLPGVGAAALQGRAVEAAGEFGQRVAVQK